MDPGDVPVPEDAATGLRSEALEEKKKKSTGHVADKVEIESKIPRELLEQVELLKEAQISTPPPMPPDTPNEPTANDLRFVWAAAGDSYGSGEGAPDRGIADVDQPSNFSGLRWSNDASHFVPMPGSNLADESFTCHRSDRAAAPKAQRKLQALYPELDFRLGFVACSGAQTQHLTQKNYDGPDYVPASRAGHDRIVQPPQLERVASFKRQNNGQLDALYLSIGGNDVGFGDLVTACLKPNVKVGAGFGFVMVGPADCRRLLSTQFPDALRQLKSNYASVNTHIQQLLGTQVSVLISEYPNPIHNGSSSNPPVCRPSDYTHRADIRFGGYDNFLKDYFSEAEAVAAFGLSDKLNDRLSASAEENGWKVIRSHVKAFEGHGICTTSPMVNLNSRAIWYQGIDLMAPDLGQLQPASVSAGFMHPNEAGYEAYADAIVASMRPLVEERLRSGLHPPVHSRVASARSSSVTLRWQDRSTSENGYEIEVIPVTGADRDKLVLPTGAIRQPHGGFMAWVRGENTQEYTHPLNGHGTFKYKIRACLFDRLPGEPCGLPAEFTGGNRPANPPANAKVRTVVHGDRYRVEVHSFSWDEVDGASRYTYRIERRDGAGTPREDTTTATFINDPPRPFTDYWFRVAACNRAGCSQYVTAPE